MTLGSPRPDFASQGKVYHLLVRYKSEEDIREELANYDWGQLEGLDLDDDEDPEVANAKYKQKMTTRETSRSMFFDPNSASIDFYSTHDARRSRFLESQNA